MSNQLSYKFPIVNSPLSLSLSLSQQQDFVASDHTKLWLISLIWLLTKIISLVKNKESQIYNLFC